MMKKVAYLGPEATFAHEAARKEFGKEAEFLPQRLIPDIFVAVAQGEADFGVVPVENSIEGAVTYTLDMFGRSGMERIKICDEIYLTVVQNLLTKPDGPQKLEDIKVVYSHPQGLAQCRQWLYNNLRQAQVRDSSSTAAAAQLAAEDPTCAAIANSLAAEKYGLRIFRPAIQDADFNQTRFLLIAKEETPFISRGEGREVTALMLSIKDRVGALHAVTSVLLKHNLNMNRIESRPSKQKAWDYVFFIDFFGHPSEPNVAAALEELQSETVWVRVLGAWTREAGALKAEE
jgi:chorismate mutase/prephenate dehydratase